MVQVTPERLEHVMRLHRQAPVIDCHNDSLQAVLKGDTRYNVLRHRPASPRRLWQKGDSGHWDFPRALEAAQTEDIRGFPNLTSALIDLGFSDAELLDILGGNWLRVFRTVWGS